MYKSIILSSCLFGSVYIFSKSLDAINSAMLEHKQIPNKLNKLVIINGLVCIISGTVFVYGIRSTLF
jgi:hypothetical protein